MTRVMSCAASWGGGADEASPPVLRRDDMTVSPWIAVALALPVLLCGEALVRRVRLLNRFNIPAPVG